MQSSVPVQSRRVLTAFPLGLLAALPAAFIAHTIYAYGVDVPFMDEWRTAVLLEKLESGELGFADLWMQQNEHRLFFTRLLYFGLAFTTQFDTRWFMACSFGIACLSSLCFYVLSRRSGSMSREQCLGSLVLVNLLVFAPVQYENWLWGIQIATYLPVLLVSLCLVLASARVALPLKVGLCAGLCMVSTFCFSSGLLGWVVVPLAILAHSPEEVRARKPLALAWVGLAAVGTLFYFAGYVHPPDHPSRWEAFLHPATASVYLLTYLGSPLAWILGHPSVPVASALGALQLGLYAACCALVFERRGDAELRRFAAPWLSIGLFALLTGAMATIARTGFGPTQALSSRYTTSSVLLGVALVYLVPRLLDERFGSRAGGVARAAAAKASLATLLILLHLLTSYHHLNRIHMTRLNRLQAKSLLAFVHVVPEDPWLTQFVSNPLEPMKRSVASLTRQGFLRPPPLETASVRDFAGERDAASYGVLEQVTLSGGSLSAWGWAVLPGRGEAADGVLLSYQRGDGEEQVFAVIAGRAQRADVVAATGRLAYLWAGWQSQVPADRLPPGRVTVRAWAFDALSNRAYALDGSRALRRRR